MTLLLRVLAMVAAGVLVAIADALLKAIAAGGLRRTAMLLVIALYAGQIAFFLYVFVRKMELGIAGNLQMVAYAAATVLVSVAWFHERLTAMQLTGIALALVGSVLMVGGGR
jgi:multidrug transporter EmrE-like cation transporter